jgi:hypothetical protein
MDADGCGWMQMDADVDVAIYLGDVCWYGKLISGLVTYQCLVGMHREEPLCAIEGVHRGFRGKLGSSEPTVCLDECGKEAHLNAKIKEITLNGIFGPGLEIVDDTQIIIVEVGIERGRFLIGHRWCALGLVYRPVNSLTVTTAVIHLCT